MSASGYSGSYPLPGDVALLCEGDLIGYETALFKRWLASRFGGRPLVDVWPAGTSKAAWSLADAIGRARPVAVVEDRDYRSLEEARSSSNKKREDREKRGVCIALWTTWNRNEIENYFLDPAVMEPVFSDWFDCSLDEVRSALREVLECLVVYQAAEYALYRIHSRWIESTEPNSILRNADHRPRLASAGRAMEAPDPNHVEQQLKKNIKTWQKKRIVAENGSLRDPFDGEQLLADYASRLDEWREVSLDGGAWRVDWSGKDILRWLRILLAARFGWPDRTTRSRRTIDWTEMKSDDQKREDRGFESAMRMDLVTALLKDLESDESAASEEWKSVATVLREAMK